MVSVKEARKLILENCRSVKVELLPLPETNDYILAAPACSLIDTPPFHQSAMDGYAFSFDSWDGKCDLTVIGEIQAGNFFSEKLKPFEAVRIYTGSALPPGADTVIMQEKVIIKNKKITFTDEQLFKGSHVRLKGSQTKKGEMTLQADQLLTPAAISFLAGTGINKVKVYAKPIISILTTGMELIMPGHPLTEGKIYESNSSGLTAALNQINISPVAVAIVDDNEEEIIKAITRQLHADILIISGGISVGDYDFVAKALEKCGVKKIFHKVKQKPGKPLYFGICDQTLVFALPGNPASVLTCFYEYVVPAISCFTRKKYFKKIKLPLANDYTKKPELTYFLKGKTMADAVSVLPHQESYLMDSFAIADCLIELEEEKANFMKGDLVTVQMII